MIILGLTGSIGMGKSTTSDMFRAEGVPVHDADATVHRLYETDLVAPLEAAFPGVTKDGAIDRAALSQKVIGDETAMKRLEAIVHPAVHAEEMTFVTREKAFGAPLVLLDIPLLFESGGHERVDKILVVTAPAAVQRDRVLTRDGMTEEKFLQILARQTPDEEKRRRADFIIDTSLGLDHARTEVRTIIDQLTSV
ncbi:MAG: dephospho-CoA kinase [Pseudomonadota bacterium]